jgi:predicted outer membrane repeat protein
MKKKFKRIAILGCLFVACAALAACGEKTKKQELQAQGYKIAVTYDPNGGTFINNAGVSITDMFNPDKYQKDENGIVSLKLLNPTDESRPTSASGQSVSLTRQGHFFVGWYETRTLLLNDNKKPYDKFGRELEFDEEEQTYYYMEENKKIGTLPVYSYSDLWDFEKDKVEYDASKYKKGIMEKTLYAGWLENYAFHYYKKNDAGEWEKLSEETTFDYVTTNAEGSKTADKDTIWFPAWQGYKVNYDYTYANGTSFSFPKVPDTTFLKAYLDEGCTQEITTASYEHKGSVNYENCTPVNPIQNIYLELDKGEQYRITEASQLKAANNPKGYYEIQADLDFAQVEWPSALSYGSFTGKMYSAEGNTYTISNVSVKFNSSTKSGGAIFGQIAAGAEVKNLNFKNVRLDLVNTGTPQSGKSYGLFTGNVDKDATVTSVTIDGGMKIGAIALGSTFEISLLANGDNVGGITKGEISLEVYGEARKNTSGEEKYWYSFNPDTVKVEGNQVTMERHSSPKEYEKAKYIIIEEKLEVNQDE